MAQFGTTNLFFPSAFAVMGLVKDSEGGSDSTGLVFLTFAVAQLDLTKDEDDEGTGGFVSQSLAADDAILATTIGVVGRRWGPSGTERYGGKREKTSGV